jgi:hypothetical protein
MAVIMSLEEPRPRGTLLGERADRRRVREVEHFFRCNACNGWIDARDYVWVEDHEGPLPPPGTRSSAKGCTVDQRGLVVRANLTGAFAHWADAWRRCADDPTTPLHLIACRMGHGLLVVERRAEIAHVEPALEEVKLNRGRPMAMALL